MNIQKLVYDWFGLGCTETNWFHDFVYTGESWRGCGDKYNPVIHDQTRRCNTCGLHQKVSYLPSVAGDGQPSEQWEKI
jgi:hypothetical protein